MRSPRSLVGGSPAAVHEITFDGRELAAQPGQSIAAVLWGAADPRLADHPRGRRPARRVLRDRQLLRLPRHRQR